MPTAEDDHTEEHDTGPVSIAVLDHDDVDEDVRDRITKRLLITSLVARLLVLTPDRRDSIHSSRDSLPQTVPTHQPLVSEFINISYDEVGVS